MLFVAGGLGCGGLEAAASVGKHEADPRTRRPWEESADVNTGENRSVG
jgi:hypothetical protein